MLARQGFKVVSLCKQQRLWSDFAHVRGDLILYLAHMSEGTFSQFEAYFTCNMLTDTCICHASKMGNLFTLSTLGKIISRWHCVIFFFLISRIWHFMQIVSSEDTLQELSFFFMGEIRKNISSLSSTDLAKRVVKVKIYHWFWKDNTQPECLMSHFKGTGYTFRGSNSIKIVFASFLKKGLL